MNTNHIEIIVSKKARARAYARIYGLPKAIQIGHDLPPLYTIEFLCEKTLPLSEKELAKVIVHELLHIPYTFKGGLRPHGKLVNNVIARKIARKIDKEIISEWKKRLEKCCRER